MAIKTRFTLVDNISNKIMNMINKVNELSGSMTDLEDVSNTTSNSLASVSKTSRMYNSSMNTLTDEINNSNQSMNRINETAQKTDMSFSRMMQTVTGLYIAFKGLQSFFNFSDKIMNIDARLNLITNGEEEASNLKNNIRNVAKTLGADFNEFADQVIKIKQLTGRTFSSNGEALRFSELLAKSFKISGTNAQQASAALYQLTQALGSGALQGDEFRSIKENAPLLVESIANAMNVSKAELKKLGAEGKITAEVIKKAVFESATDIENKFEQMSRTWGQLFNIIKTKFTEVADSFFKVFNTIAGNIVITGIINDVMVLVGVFLTAGSKILSVTLMILEALEPLKYLIYGILLAFIAYNSVIAIHALVIAGVSKAISAWVIIQKILNGQISIMNALLNLNPIGLMIGVIIAFIAILQSGISMFNKFTGATKTLLGVIVGSIYAAFSIIGNIFIGIINIVINVINTLVTGGSTIAEALYNIFVSPVSTIKNYVISVINFVLEGVKKLLSIADKVARTNLASSVENLQERLADKQVYTKGMVKWSKNAPKLGELGYFNVKNAWNKGNSVGDDMQSKLSNMFSDDSKNLLKDMDSKLGNIDNNTEKGADSTKEFVEDLKLLSDMAHREYIAEITTPTINIEIKNDNHINTEEDKQDFIKTLTEQVSLAVLGGARKGIIR